MIGEESIERELQFFFSKSSVEDWKQIAQQELRGKDPIETLSWRGKDEIFFLPYYDAEGDTQLHFLDSFRLPAGKNSPARPWVNVPCIQFTNEETANTISLQHLSSGADGVVFDLRSIRRADLKVLTNKIEWPHCYIGFYAGEDPVLISSAADLIQTRFIPATIRGALFWESIPKKTDLHFYFHHCPNLKALGLFIKATTPANEICEALLHGVQTIDAFAEKADVKHIVRSIAFSFHADASFLECIAKFKALRILWLQIAHAYGCTDFGPADLHVHARSAVVPDGEFGPHENMLKGSFTAMAAVLGGCDALTIEPGSDTSVSERWARNVSSILAEESYFKQVTDPLAGAWTLDTMTTEIAKQAWTLFQTKWANYAKA